MKKNSQAQLQGVLLGLAIGDALGAPVEHGYTSDEIVARKEELRHMHTFLVASGQTTLLWHYV